MTDLSDDELTVLMIAQQGERLIPIGRWEQPVQSLVAKGFLRPQPNSADPNGNFNNVITEKGKALLLQKEDAPFREMIDVNNRIVHAQHDLAATSERIAVELATMARTSATVLGHDRTHALREWSRQILKRALELIGD